MKPWAGHVNHLLKMENGVFYSLKCLFNCSSKMSIYILNYKGLKKARFKVENHFLSNLDNKIKIIIINNPHCIWVLTLSYFLWK